MGEAIISRTLESDILVVQETGTSTTDVMSQKAVTDELNNKVDKVEGKGLSTNDFTAEDKEKLDNAVPTTRTVNSKPLTSDIVLTPEDIGALPTSFSNHTHSADNITSGVLPVSRGGTGSDTPEYARSNLDVYSKAEVDFKLSASNLGNILYPVGSIYLSVNSTNPQYLFGGTWVQWGSGRVPVGINTSDGSFNTVEKTGGSKEHRHEFRIGMHWYYGAACGEGAYNSTGAYRFSDGNYDGWARELAAINVTLNTNTTTSTKTGSANGKWSKGDTANTSTLQPYITCYMWKRTT